MWPLSLGSFVYLPDAAGFPSEQGTYSATFGTGPGMRPMPGLRVSRPALLERPQSDCIFFDVCVDSVGSPVIPFRCGRVSSEASISARDASEPRHTEVPRGLGFSFAGTGGSVG